MKTTDPAGIESIYVYQSLRLIHGPADFQETYVVSSGLWVVLVVLSHVFDCVGRADDLGWSVLSFRRPESQAGQEPAVRDFEL